MTTSQKTAPGASLESMTHPSRDELAAMTYAEWLAYHRAQPGGWLTTSAPDELLYACYEKRLATFDACKADAPDAEAEFDADEEFS
jgi:hypothetical protein